MKDQGHLVNFRNSIRTGNKKEARKIMREYGIRDFFFDYAQYLESLGYEDSTILLDELFQALANFKYIN